MLTFYIENCVQGTMVRCSGRIVHGDEANALFRAVKSQDRRHIHIDLTDVSTIDAGGLGVLAALERWARDTDRRIQLVNPTKRVWAALEITGLTTVFQVSYRRHSAA